MIASLVSVFPAHARFYDCSVVYDEFDNLMNKDFLVQPDRYVAVVEQRMTQPDFESQQRGKFLLYAGRAPLGVAIFRTDENRHGKFLYRWNDPLIEGQSYLVIDEVVTYGRVADGYAPRRTGPFRIRPGAGLDIDSGRTVNILPHTPGDDAARIDIRHAVDPESGQASIAAANTSVLSFPIESLCHKLE